MNRRRRLQLSALALTALALTGCGSDFAREWEEAGEQVEEQAQQQRAVELQQQRAADPAVLPFTPLTEEDDAYLSRSGTRDFFKESWDGSYRWCFQVEHSGRYSSPTMHCEPMPEGWTPADGYPQAQDSAP